MKYCCGDPHLNKHRLSTSKNSRSSSHLTTFEDVPPIDLNCSMANFKCSLFFILKRYSGIYGEFKLTIAAEPMVAELLKSWELDKLPITIRWV
jgi:hypothetical protein